MALQRCNSLNEGSTNKNRFWTEGQKNKPVAVVLEKDIVRGSLVSQSSVIKICFYLLLYDVLPFSM